MKRLLLWLLCLLLWLPLFSESKDSTYVKNGTTYYYNTFYKNGNPKVKRSTAAKKAFLKTLGLIKTPEGYEIDHITPLHKGGLDTPDNMQLLTIEEHKEKTKRERKTPN